MDLGCGRAGPGLWLAAGGCLVGRGGFLTRRGRSGRTPAALFGLAGRARFVVGDLAHTGPPQASADAAVSIDAFHFAADPAAAAVEARRILRPGRRLVLTNWQPKVPDDDRLLARNRIDWPRVLSGAGFADIQMEPGPSGTTCRPASTGSPSTSVTPAPTPAAHRDGRPVDAVVEPGAVVRVAARSQRHPRGRG